MNSRRLPKLSPLQALSLYHMLKNFNQVPLLSSEASDNEVHLNVHQSYIFLLLAKVGVNISSFRDFSNSEMNYLKDIRKELSWSYEGLGYMDIDNDSLWYYLDFPEENIIGAKMFASFFIDEGLDFLSTIEAASRYFQHLHECDIKKSMEIETAVCNADRNRDTMRALTFVNGLKDCFTKGTDILYENPEMINFYELVCLIDGTLYEENKALFIKHLPFLLTQIFSGYSYPFFLRGAEQYDTACIGLSFWLIPDSTFLLQPDLREESEEVKALKWVLETITKSEYEVFQYDDISCTHISGNDIMVATVVPSGVEWTETVLPSIERVLAPLIWEALFPIVKQQYTNEQHISNPKRC